MQHMQIQLSISLSLSLNLCNTCTPVQSKMSIYSKSLNNSVSKNPNTSNYLTSLTVKLQLPFC